MATLGLTAAERAAIDEFKRTVIEPSMTNLVILDFWAPWCGPCKALTPVLERVAAQYASRNVVLAKVNIDENRLVADQFRVQSVPTVYAVFQGQLVADLTPARTEEQLRRMLDQILGQLPLGAAQPSAEVEPLVAMGEELLASGDAERAVSVFSQLLDMAPEHPAVLAGLARAMIASNRIDEAEALLAGVPEALAKDGGIVRARAAIALAHDGGGDADLSALRAQVAAEEGEGADPSKGMESRLALAKALVAQGQRDEAADILLAMIAADREWNGGAARAQLLKIFEAIGLEDPWVAAQRRRLSAVLFG